MPYLLQAFGLAGMRGFGRKVTLGAEDWRTVYDATVVRYELFGDVRVRGTARLSVRPLASAHPLAAPARRLAAYRHTRTDGTRHLPRCSALDQLMIKARFRFLATGRSRIPPARRIGGQVITGYLIGRAPTSIAFLAFFTGAAESLDCLPVVFQVFHHLAAFQDLAQWLPTNIAQ